MTLGRLFIGFEGSAVVRVARLRRSMGLGERECSVVSGWEGSQDVFVRTCDRLVGYGIGPTRTDEDEGVPLPCVCVLLRQDGVGAIQSV